jgi:hypothetical protein
MLHRVALVRTDVSEELRASFIRVTRIGELGTTLAVSSRRTLRRNTNTASHPKGRHSLRVVLFGKVIIICVFFYRDAWTEDWYKQRLGFCWSFDTLTSWVAPNPLLAQTLVQGPPLRSSVHSSWLQALRSRVRFLALSDFLSSRGFGTVSTQPLWK